MLGLLEVASDSARTACRRRGRAHPPRKEAVAEARRLPFASPRTVLARSLRSRSGLAWTGLLLSKQSLADRPVYQQPAEDP